MKIKDLFKYLIAFSLVAGVALSAVSFKPHEKSDIVNNSYDDQPVYYWFYATVKIEDMTNSYKITGTPGGIQYGYEIDFEKDLWANLSQRKLAIGPFLSKNEAINARRLYKSDADKINQLPKDSVPQQVHWFAITFDQSDRLRILVFERAPGAVQTGTEDQFINAFYEQLINKLFAIGPFYDYNQAEIAKRLYRKNE